MAAPGRAQILWVHPVVVFRPADRRRSARGEPRNASPPGKLDSGFGGIGLHGAGNRRDAIANDYGDVGDGQWRAHRAATRSPRTAPRDENGRTATTAAPPSHPGDDCR